MTRGAGRKDLGHSEQLMLKIHPDLKDHLEEQSARNYVTVAEYIRQLVIADMRKERE